MSLRRGRGWGGGGWDTALQNFYQPHEQPNRSFLDVNPTNAAKSILESTLLDVFSRLATYQPAPGPFKEHLCACGHQIGHRNKLWEKQTEEEWTVK